MSSVIRVGSAALIIYLLYCLALFMLQRRMLFPRHYMEAPAPATPKDALRLNFEHEAGRSEALLLLGDGVSAAAPGPVVFYAHGNGATVQDALPFIRPYQRLGVTIACLEYRGYGRSEGEPSEAALIADAIAFHDQVIARPEIDASRVILHGHSLGGGVISGVAVARPPKALILSSTFASVRRMARKRLAPGFLVRDSFESARRLKGLKVPTLLTHGRHDDLIPFEHGEAIAEAAPHARFIPLSCAHNDCPIQWDAIAALLSAEGLLGPSK